MKSIHIRCIIKVKINLNYEISILVITYFKIEPTIRQNITDKIFFYSKNTICENFFKLTLLKISTI